MSKDIKAGKLPQQYHVVLDEAYILVLNKKCLLGRAKTCQWKRMHSIIICH